MGGGLALSPFFMKTFLLLLLSASIACASEEPAGPLDYSELTAAGLYDSEDGRIYLRDIRQLLGWIVGLHLVRLTCQAFRPM